MSPSKESKHDKRHRSSGPGTGSVPSEPWQLTGMYGGKFHPKTQFSRDERLDISSDGANRTRYLLTASQTSSKIFSASTGQFSHSIGCVRDSLITDFILDPVNEFRLLIASSDHYLRMYDWTDGLLIAVSA
jgi:hypothetical protein